MPLSIANKRSQIYNNSTVLWYILSCQVKMLYTCNDPDCYSVKWKHLTRFDVRLRCYRKLSTSYQHFINILIHNSSNINNHHTNLSTLYINLSTFQNIVNTTLLHSYPHNNIKLSTPQHLIIHTISHSIEYYILTRSKIHLFLVLPVSTYL